VRRGPRLRCGRRRGIFGDCGVQHCIKLSDIIHLGIALLRDDEDARSLGKADSFAQGVVGMNLGGEEAAGVNDEWHDAAVGLEILLGEGVEVFLRRYRGLVRENRAAIFFCGLGRDLVLDVAGDNGSVKTPDVHLEGKVMAYERDLVLIDGRMDDGEGASAGGALEILKLVDGDPGAGGGAEHRGVFKGRLGEGRDAGWDGDQQSGGDDKEAIHKSKTHRIIFRILAEGAGERS
jgi:hypothetical protein